MAIKRISGLSKLVKLLVVLCEVIGIYGPKIRAYVPAPNQAAYDDALQAILDACEVIRAIDYLDGVAGTSAPWGS